MYICVQVCMCVTIWYVYTYELQARERNSQHVYKQVRLLEINFFYKRCDQYSTDLF